MLPLGPLPITALRAAARLGVFALPLSATGRSPTCAAELAGRAAATHARGVPDFIDSLPFLSDEQRTKVRAADLDVPAAIVVLSAAEIVTHTGLTIGKAGLLLTHARAATTAVAGPSTTEADRIYQARRGAIELALQALRAEPAPHRRKAIRDMGVECVVRDAEGRVNPSGTMAMLADLEDGAPVPKTWQGEQVVPVRDIGLPTVFCHPRTHEVLQGGVPRSPKILGPRSSMMGRAPYCVIRARASYYYRCSVLSIWC